MPGMPSTAARGHSRPILTAIGLAMLLTAIALGVVYRQVAITEMTDRGARDHAALVQALGRGLYFKNDPRASEWNLLRAFSGRGSSLLSRSARKGGAV